MDDRQARVLALSLYYLGLVQGGRKYVRVSDFADLAAPELKVDLLACVADLLHWQIARHAEAEPNIELDGSHGELLAQLARDIARFVGTKPD